MPIIQVFHNPHFLDYDGSHSRIVPPVRPTASVNIAAAGLELNDMLGAAYAWTQHGYLYPSWFNDPAVIPHLRSTSVGDLLAAEDGALYVVESFGFQPYRPKAIFPSTSWPRRTGCLTLPVIGCPARGMGNWQRPCSRHWRPWNISWSPKVIRPATRPSCGTTRR